MRNPIRKIINKFGLDLHNYRHEADRMAWLKGLSIRTVFDIGANVGQFAKEIREKLPLAQIYSFEPIKECFDELNESFVTDKRFRAFNYALGETEQSSMMNRSSYTPSSSLLSMAESHKRLFPHTKENKPEKIHVRRLDEMFAELNPPKEILIKVDTQGYEDKVIAGGSEAFSRAKAVIIEASFVRLYEEQPLFDDIYEKMKLLSLSYKGALHQKINPKTGEVIFEDAIFTKD